MKCKVQSNGNMKHLEPMEDAKKEPYKTTGYTQNTKTQKPKQTLKEKPFLPL
jgi:hypothetical protein